MSYVSLKLVPKDPRNLFEFEQDFKKFYDDVVAIVLREADAAAVNIRERLEGADTGPKIPGAQLRRRSGDASASIGTKVTRDEGGFRTSVLIGAIDANEDVAQYLEVQNLGGTITPLYAEKLAFPPGDAGPAIRDEEGVQLYSAEGGGGLPSFRENMEQFGISAMIYTDDVIMGRIEGTRDMVLLFIRREEVDIPPRAPIDFEIVPTLERIDTAIERVRGE